MSDRYFINEPISSDHVVLDGPEAHHVIHVMRAAVGMRVTLFDGSGAEFPAVVQRVGRREIELSILERKEVDRELPFDLTLGVALPKGDRQKWLVEKAVELGVTRIVSLQTQRSVAQPIDQALARLRRAVVEASKQCGRNRLMQIDAPQAWPDCIGGSAGAPCRWIAHPQEHPNDLHLLKREQWDDVVLAVGPEGGFTNDEVALAVAAGWCIVDLGRRILRVETAAILMAALVVSAAGLSMVQTS